MLCVPKGTVSFIWIYASKMWKKGPLKTKDINPKKGDASSGKYNTRRFDLSVCINQALLLSV